MIKKDSLGFAVFTCLFVVFFIIPEPFQKLFRIALGVSFPLVFFSMLAKKQISNNYLLFAILVTVFVVAVALKGNFQSSLLNLYLSFFYVSIVDKLAFELSDKKKKILDILFIISAFSMILQFFYFRSIDGRPNLGYEVNLTGAYLFLFFLYSDIRHSRIGMILVIAFSLFLLSRLLIYSIILFYFVRFVKDKLFVRRFRLNIPFVVFITYICFSIFSFWYVYNVSAEIAYSTDKSRIVNLNDGSNQMRFIINTRIMENIIMGEGDDIKYGYGDVRNNPDYYEEYFIMPHNELFDLIVEFGLYLTLLIIPFSLFKYQKLCCYQNIEYFIPLLFYSLLLWVRFIIAPSFEMIFIMFLLMLSSKIISNKRKSTNVI